MRGSRPRGPALHAAEHRHLRGYGAALYGRRAGNLTEPPKTTKADLDLAGNTSSGGPTLVMQRLW